jgi:phosphoglycolate phosphatase
MKCLPRAVLAPAARRPSSRTLGKLRWLSGLAGTLSTDLSPLRKRRRCAIGDIDRLVLWNVDLTLVDVGRTSRDAYADAFRKATGRPLVHLPQLAGRSDSEIFFESLALNDLPADGDDDVSDSDLLARYCWELEASFALRQEDIAQLGRLLPGARAAVVAAAALPGVVQSVLTGSIKPNAVAKLKAFGLTQYLDLAIGGYGSDAYPRGSLLLMTRTRVGEKYGAPIGEQSTVYIADSCRDIEAAAVGGAHCIAVATGRDTVAELKEAGASLVLTDLSDTQQVLTAIDRLTRVPAGRRH